MAATDGDDEVNCTQQDDELMREMTKLLRDSSVSSGARDMAAEVVDWLARQERRASAGLGR